METRHSPKTLTFTLSVPDSRHYPLSFQSLNNYYTASLQHLLLHIEDSDPPTDVNPSAGIYGTEIRVRFPIYLA